ncbi:hypothetical protein PHMEG_00026010 [Phytophthora megakarya]|uniref:Uncharacterized protein n=1 Tax=Phytophthora megakarya TaxID=4795 RepID=A0A225VD62_9STRA|nr:hypothetical protein PHMEG_00026010 [Phytophthora megakarya]
MEVQQELLEEKAAGMIQKTGQQLKWTCYEGEEDRSDLSRCPHCCKCPHQALLWSMLEERWITMDHYKSLLDAGKIELVLEWRVGNDPVACPD